MSTRAVVVDGRVEGKGFYVHHDEYPTGLGNELRTVFKPGMSIEEVFTMWQQFKRQQYINFMQNVYGQVDPNEVNQYQNKGVCPLTPEQANIARTDSLRAARNAIEINLEYIYIIKDDGIYMKGRTVPKLRKVKENETDRG